MTNDLDQSGQGRGDGQSSAPFPFAGWMHRAFAAPAAQFAFCLALALITRVSVFGDTNYHNDELFYFLAGQRMHDGLLPYVDAWDRKGPGLFLIYWLLAGISRSVLSYQIAATLFAAATAFLANRIAAPFAGQRGALLGAALYLFLLPLFAGAGGQAPVFYNLFIAIAAWIVFSCLDELRRGRVRWPIHLAMASAGFAATFKQTALFEGAFLGCVVVWQLHRGGMTPTRLAARAASLALAGAAPMLLFAAIYAGVGHFVEFWHAMVTANLSKPVNPGGNAGQRIGSLAIIASPLLVPALATLLFKPNPGPRPVPRALLTGWLLAALSGFFAIPNFIDHYALPLLLPLAVIAAPALGWRLVGPAFGLFALALVALTGKPFQFHQRAQSRQAMVELVARIRQRDPAPRLLVYQGPAYLYALVGSWPPTPLIYPVHLFHAPEDNTSHLDTATEMRKVLAWRPTVVVRYPDFPPEFLNARTAPLVEAYVRHCAPPFRHTVIDYYGAQEVEVFTGCGRVN